MSINFGYAIQSLLSFTSIAPKIYPPFKDSGVNIILLRFGKCKHFQNGPETKKKIKEKSFAVVYSKCRHKTTSPLNYQFCSHEIIRKPLVWPLMMNIDYLIFLKSSLL